MGIEKITNRITAEAQAEREAIIEEAQRAAETVLSEARAKAEAILLKAENDGRNEKEKLIKYRKSTADIDAGKIILAKKQEILSECFAEIEERIIHTDEDRYIELLIALGKSADMYGGTLLFNADEKNRIGQAVCDGLNAAVAAKRRDKYGDGIQYAERFTLSEDVGTMKGGYVITYRATFADCTVESLVNEHRADLAGEAAKLLFD